MGLASEYPPAVYQGLSAGAAAQVRSEQVRLLCRATPLSLAVGTINAVVLVAVNWAVMPAAVLLGWLATMVVWSLWRLWVLLTRHRPPVDERRIERQLSVGIVGSALLWGSSAWFLFPIDSPAHQTFVTMILVGMAAGAVATLSGHRLTSLLVVGLILLPLSLRWYLVGTPLAMVLAGLVLLLTLITTASALRIRQSIFQNVELRVRAATREEALRASEVRFERLFEVSPLGLLQYDAQGKVVACNLALAEVLGVERDAVMGFDLLKTLPDGDLKRAVSDSLASGKGSFQGDYESAAGGKKVPLRTLMVGLPDAAGSYSGGFAIVEDITRQRQAQQEMERQALYDPLTELPNRRLLLEQLNQEYARARRHGHRSGLLFLDLDHFKTINDSLGHRVGDQLLRAVARRLQEQLRREDTAARLGGDEFVVLMSEIGDQDDQALTILRERAEGIARVLAEPYRLEGHLLPITASIGVTLFPNSSQDAEAVLQHADAAMYRAKGEGRNRVRFFELAMQQAAEQRLAIEQALRLAPRQGELRVFWQAQVDAQGGLVGAEALLRWMHPQRGLLLPRDFITVAEEVGLIAELGEWVLAAVCRWLSEQPPSSAPLPIAVNISPRQFQRSDFVDRTRDIIQRHRVDPHLIEMEITEGVLLDDTHEAADKMRELQSLGIRFAIDDFGTGYSSLSYLKKLPVDRLKVDRSFIRDIATDANDAAIVDTILSVARHLGLVAVAEGVETREQFDFLRSRGCNAFQGYYFGRPVEADSYDELL